MSSKPPRQKPKRRVKPTTRAQHAGAASAQPEELSPDERAELDLKLAARAQRGRPPSI